MFASCSRAAPRNALPDACVHVDACRDAVSDVTAIVFAHDDFASHAARTLYGALGFAGAGAVERGLSNVATTGNDL
jgi:hypothetical protein